MFCRFGELELKRPVAVPNALKRAWMRPSGVSLSNSDLPYVLRIFSASFYSIHVATLGSNSSSRCMAS